MTPAVGLPFRSISKAARRLIAGARRRARDAVRGETAATLFDAHDLRTLNAVLAECGIPPLTADPRQADVDVAGATRFVLGLLATSSRLRRQFPTALTDGPDGAFCRWLSAPGARSAGLSPAGAENVRAAFAAYPGERVKRVFELRGDLRETFPLGLTPHPDRGRFLRWLLTHGAQDFSLSAEEALWHLFERDELPDRGLDATYRLRPDWQAAVPAALTPGGWPAFLTFLGDKHGLRSRWTRNARLGRPADPSAAGGANVVGHFRYASGLQEVAFGVANGLRRAGVPTSLRDLPVTFPCDWRDRERYQGLEVHDATIWVAAVNTFPADWHPRAGLYRRPGVKRIAVWYWELEELPAEWVGRLGWADEVWAPTRFIADAFRRHVWVPVVPMLPGVELPAFDRRPRNHLGLPDGRFLFLFSFDMASVMARKNPLAVIEAHRRAFRPDDRAHLAIKVSRGDKDPASLARLRAAAGAAGVTLIDRVLTREDALALLGAADCYVSLHRSEGLGLGMAESMLLGKPVVATGYGGNLDFMPPGTGYLVDYQRVPIAEDLPPYPKGCHWAEPSVGHAAELMRRVFDHRDEAREVGDRAKAHVSRVLSVDAAGRRMAARLRELAAGRGGIA